MKVRTFVEPMFYRAAYRACLNAEHAHGKATEPSSASYWIAEEIESSASSIVHSVMCLEAYINGFITDNCSEIANDLERMELKSKWLVIPRLVGVTDCFKKGAQPFQDFAALVGWRNELMHYKHTYSTPVEDQTLGRISSLHDICNAKNARVALNNIANMIRYISNKRGTPLPNWLENAVGWLEPLH